MNTKKKWYAKAIRAGTGVTFRHRPTSIPGTHVLEANWEYTPVPLASMWYTWSGKHSIAILEMYTSRHYRRLGVQQKILLRLLNDFPDCFEVTTESATTASEAWLRRAGFGNGELAGFILKVPSRHPHFKKEQCKKQSKGRTAKRTNTTSRR